MTDDEADEIMRAAIQKVTGGKIVGSFVIVATVYDADGESRTATMSQEGMLVTDQIGLLTSALNRANAIDAEGWERARRDDDA